ncbi:unnamed protein product [Phytophthora lilii]|uniref:Unnamed protein product n=1 Tax=Phytophthora lilii TaxID=2077276 RepID=A0A9W6YEK7_9STRA|nr:unnamed protein product [Phytophthora lilii]
MKFGDLALQTLLIYQMLEAGSPMPLITIDTVVVASNAHVCAALMFARYDRAPLAESFADIMYETAHVLLNPFSSSICRFDFVIIIACPLLVVFYCLSTFTFDRAKLKINLVVYPASSFEHDASALANAEQTAVIYEVSTRCASCQR